MQQQRTNTETAQQDEQFHDFFPGFLDDWSPA